MFCITVSTDMIYKKTKGKISSVMTGGLVYHRLVELLLCILCTVPVYAEKKEFILEQF